MRKCISNKKANFKLTFSKIKYLYRDLFCHDCHFPVQFDLFLVYLQALYSQYFFIFLPHTFIYLSKTLLVSSFPIPNTNISSLIQA